MFLTPKFYPSRAFHDASYRLVKHRLKDGSRHQSDNRKAEYRSALFGFPQCFSVIRVSNQFYAWRDVSGA